jgi:hypothetical protein
VIGHFGDGCGDEEGGEEKNAMILIYIFSRLTGW